MFEMALPRGAEERGIRVMKTVTRWKQALLAATASVVAATGAYAQTPGTKTEGLEDIIVTARKRSESLISVPVAVTAITGTEVQRQGVTDLNRIAQLAPQVMLAKADSGAGATFTIRGLGSSPVDAGLEQSVTVVIDGVPITRGNVISAGLFDLEQVEVLKGPQALFFGKNSPAGVVSLRTANPTDTVSGYLRGGYEFEAREKYGEAAIGGPITDTLKGRFAFRGSAMRGWVQNVAEPLSPAQNPFYPTTGSPGAGAPWDPGTKEYMGRVTLVWTPSDVFDATVKASGNHYHDNGTTTQAYCFDGTAPSNDPGAIPGNPPRFLDPANDCKFDNKLASVGIDPSLIHDWPLMHADGKPYSDQNTILTSLTMNYHLPNITVTSVTSGMNLNYKQSNDYAFTSFGGIPVALGEDTHSYSEEVRLVSEYEGRINFTAGAFYENVDRKTQVNSFLFFVGVDPATGKYHTDQIVGANKAKTVSGFGQLRIQVLKNVEIAGGVRYTSESRDQFLNNDYYNPVSGAILGLVPTGFPGSPFRGKFKDSNWSPEATISWKPAQDLMFYAAYKTGYKSGGFSNPSLYQIDPSTGRPPVPSDYAFAPEKAKGYEIGFKGFMFDRRLRIETAAYRFNYTGLQLSVFNPQTFSFFIRNAGNARIQGFEVAGEFAATQMLRLNASFTYNDARFTDFPNGQCYTNQPTASAPTKGACFNQTQPLTGATLPRAPRYTFTAGGSYDRAINDRLMFGINGGVNYSAKYFTQDDHNPLTVQKAFTRADAGLRIYTPDDKYELAVIGRNLTNKYYIEYSTSKAFGKTTGDFQAATPRTREVRLQFTYKF